MDSNYINRNSCEIMPAMNTAIHRSLTERLLHAVTFEAVAIVLCAPVIGWSMDAPLATTGSLTLAISLVAMGWNVVFNALFDAAQRRLGFERSWGVRTGHALMFELGLALMTVPMAAAWLGITWWQALVLDAAILLFFLPYTVLFNAGWDAAREAWLARRRRPCPAGR